MTTVQLIYLSVVFLAVLGVALFIAYTLTPGVARSRLGKLSAEDHGVEEGHLGEWQKTIVKLAGPLAKLALPKEGWENSHLRIRFMNAGFRGKSAPVLYFLAKVLLAVLFPALAVFYVGVSDVKPGANVIVLGLLALTGFGYYLPNGILARLIAARQRELFENFPDALDLMMVCVEAGLALDAAIARVGEEMRLKSRILAEEFHLVNLELRAGRTREQALRNLALRTGVEEIDSLVAMLVQADRFGTSVADSLRVHSDSLRTKRRLIAEEAAAKIPVKLLFPLIFFIFPSLLLVLLGPAFISVYRVLLPTLGGQ
ncbi:MAG: type II secretion system F family protein [Rhodocyclaceae bacterium]|nr:type II secretion system F family protein [Rhodocyclaceae bacterium]